MQDYQLFVMVLVVLRLMHDLLTKCGLFGGSVDFWPTLYMEDLSAVLIIYCTF